MSATSILRHAPRGAHQPVAPLDPEASGEERRLLDACGRARSRAACRTENALGRPAVDVCGAAMALPSVVAVQGDTFGGGAWDRHRSSWLRAAVPAEAWIRVVSPSEDALRPVSGTLVIDRDVPVVDVARLRAFVVDGGQVQLSRLDLLDPETGAVCHALQRLLSCRVTASLSLTPGDVVEPRTESPAQLLHLFTTGIPVTVFPPPDGVAHEPLAIDVAPSEGLAVPPGWRLRIEEPGVHAFVTIAVERPVVADLFRIAHDLSLYWPVFRADAPVQLDRPVASYGGSLFDEADSFSRSVHLLASDGLWERLWATTSASLSRQAPLDSMTTRDGGDALYRYCLGGFPGVMKRDDPETLTLAGARSAACIDRRAVMVLAAIIEREVATMSDLVAAFPDEVPGFAAEALFAFVDLGWIEPCGRASALDQRP